MRNTTTFLKGKRWLCRPSFIFLILLFSGSAFLKTYSQNCPYNIDFETGTFDGWTCYTGFTEAVGEQNEINLLPSGPVPNRQTMYTDNGAGELDYYGHFPVNCPNGSRHSIRLGNNLGGGEAEGISYDFTIPANENVYSLIYHYAVVFQDPNHLEYQQPRMEIEITNVTDNNLISCSSFTFHPYGSILPGFFESPNPDDATPVWCKDWSAVTVNLNGLAGKKIRLFFKTADCTFQKHFGYAYIDVNYQCGNEFVGASYCPDDTTVRVVAPYGYQNYIWYNSSFSQTLGNEQVLPFTPPPPAGTTVAVELTPYNGYGCLDTLYARLIDTLKVFANAGPDVSFCNNDPIAIGELPQPGFTYNWSPPVGLSNPDISNPIASPDVITTYVVTSRSLGGGCRTTDTVVVKPSFVSSAIELLGKASYCINNGDSSVLHVQPTENIQWFKNDIAINGANQPVYHANQSGSYYAMLTNEDGCSIKTATQDILIDRAKPGIAYPVQYAVINLAETLEARQFGDSVLWSPGTYLDTRTSYTPTFKGSTDQLYTIQIVTNTGCVTVDTQMVKTIDKVKMFVPTAFTPNHDGKNDVLRPVLLGIKELRYFRVFNRWGQLMFETKTNYAGWDGTYRGVPQSSQVYVWEVQGLGVDGTVYMQKGSSVLLR